MLAKAIGISITNRRGNSAGGAGMGPRVFRGGQAPDSLRSMSVCARNSGRSAQAPGPDGSFREWCPRPSLPIIGPTEYRLLPDEDRERLGEWISGVIGQPIEDAKIFSAELGEGELVCVQGLL